MTDFRTWSTTAASNTATGGISIVEGMSPSAVNDALRGLIAELAGMVATLGGAAQVGTVGGTADAITLAPTVALTAYAANQTFLFKAGGANTVSNPTLNVSSVGAKTIKLPGGTALPIPAWATNDYVLLVYDGTDLILIGNTKHEFSTAAANVATKAVPVLADRALHQDSAASNAPKYSTWQTVFDMLNTLTQKSTPTTSDKVPISDAAASGVAKYATIADIQTAMIATQAQQETGTANTANVTPGTQIFHDSAAKFWVAFTVSGGVVTTNDSLNCSSVDDDGAADYGLNFTAAFSSAGYAPAGWCRSSVASAFQGVSADPGDAMSTSAIDIRVRRGNDGGTGDPEALGFLIFGDR